MPRSGIEIGKVPALMLAGVFFVAMCGFAKAAEYAPLTKAQDAWITYYSENNAEGMASLFADNAHFAGVVTPQWLVGQKRILAAWQAFFERFPVSEVEIYKYHDSEAELTAGASAAGRDSVWVETGCLIMDLKTSQSDPGVRMPTRYDRTWLCRGEGCKVIMMHDSLPGAPGKLEEPLDDRDSCYSD